MALMIVVAVLRLLRISSLVAHWSGARRRGGRGGWRSGLCGPLLAPLGKANLVIFFVVIVAVNVFSGVPIAFSFALATFGYLALTTTTPMLVMVGRLDEGMSHLILLAVPLFIFLGALIEMTGMARAMIQFLASLLGHVRGGLSYVLIGAMYLVSGISGSKIADMAAIAPVLFPEMKKRGAKPGDLVALLATTGAQTETIPPSIVLITIGSVTGLSIAALFTGGLLPAVVLGLVPVRGGLVALPQGRPEPGQALHQRRNRTPVRHRAAGGPAAVRDSRGGGGRRGHGDRSVDHRHRLLRVDGNLPLPAISVATAAADAGGNGGVVRRHHLHRRLRHGHGLGPDAIRVFAGPGAMDAAHSRRIATAFSPCRSSRS